MEIGRRSHRYEVEEGIKKKAAISNGTRCAVNNSTDRYFGLPIISPREPSIRIGYPSHRPGMINDTILISGVIGDNSSRSNSREKRDRREITARFRFPDPSESAA